MSHTESFSMNCSVSGVSGLDNFDAKKFGTFSTDQQTREFMMNRFLPAAKAMTIQPSQYSSKKQSVVKNWFRMQRSPWLINTPLILYHILVKFKTMKVKMKVMFMTMTILRVC